jgi:hypothetical protein
MIKIQDLLKSAKEHISDFENATNDWKIMPRGILRSEAFFVRAVVGNTPEANQLLESGRAQGQSTYLFSQAFPRLQIVSVEQKHSHKDAGIALQRLAPIASVSCLFGDSRKILPEIVRSGDVVVIDGPKDLMALELGLKVMRKNKPSFVFIHDAYRGSELRKYLERKLPWAIYSDEPEFLSHYCFLDVGIEPEKIKKWSDLETQPPNENYGGTFACLQYREGFPLKSDILSVWLAKTLDRWKRSAAKRWGKCEKKSHSDAT